MKLNFKESDILIIDFGNLFYYSRPHHLTEEVLKGSYGVFEQFIINLNSYNKIFQPSTIIIADDNFPMWRREIYPLYKKDREDKYYNPEKIDIEYNRNKKAIREELKKFLPIYYFRIDGLEADDICYLLCRKLSPKRNVLVMSNDNDLLQLSQKFETVKIIDPHSKKIKQPPEYDIVRYKSLVGDSDNVKGVLGIGEKTAKKLLSKKRTFNEWYQNLDDENKKIYQSCKSIIDLEKIPNEYIKEFIKQYKEYEFQNFNGVYLDEIIDRYKFTRVLKSKILEENFSNLKSIE